jgi:alkyl sulfatase BDS1-like metallo-beta-lactamase superfamily hydrolase
MCNEERRKKENAARGFIGKPATLRIKNAQGPPVWDLGSYKATSVWINQRCGMQTKP